MKMTEHFSTPVIETNSLSPCSSPVMNDTSAEEKIGTVGETGSCLVGGHSFRQQGDILVDAAARHIPNPKHVRLRFDSREYFELLARHPKTLPAFRSARHVQLALGDTIYDVY